MSHAPSWPTLSVSLSLSLSLLPAVFDRRCPAPLEILGLVGIVTGIILTFLLAIRIYTGFMRKYPEYAKSHVASFMILLSHFQTLTIIGSMQLGWPLVIKQILATINLPIMG